MANFKIIITAQADKDLIKLRQYPALVKKANTILTELSENPFVPPLEKLCGELCNMYSKRLNKQHRLVYSVDKENKTIKILSLWTHYENI
ncbi:MAG: Txe/YoeB family addiction module toxin [Roseburia sp.]|nr:Txe/YoeB family addiction module toxin [Roseburia sp.]